MSTTTTIETPSIDGVSWPKLPATIQPESITAVVDSREQTPLCLDPLRVEVGALTTGDYSLLGLTDHVSVERKTLPDLLGCIGRERDRFDKEIQRLKAYAVRALAVESTKTLNSFVR